MNNSEVILECNDVSTFFKVKKGTLKAVNGVSLQIHKGETIGLVGESGCGKTTLGRTIMRLYKPNSGQILFKGKDIFDYKASEGKDYFKKVQMIYQDPYASLDPLMVVSDSIEEGMIIHKMYDEKTRKKRVLELLEMVGLNSEHANRFPHEFSGGQRQRIGIARALALEPELIVCDEPISALDVSIQAQVVNLLKDLQDKMGLSYLFITHDLSMVRQISSRIAVMYLGSLVELADSEDIYTSSLHPYTKALLSAIPIADPEVEEKRKRILLNGDVPSPINLPEGCPFASRCPNCMERCKHEKPSLKEVKPNHFCECFLGENNE